MAPSVQAEPIPGDLRPLIAQALAGVLGVNRVLVMELPQPDGPAPTPAPAPMLALDAEGVPVVVSFDAHDGSAALINGANAHAALTARGAWLMRLCPSIPADTPFDSLRVLVLAPHIGEGLPLLVSGNENLALATLAALRIGGELSLVLTPWQTPTPGHLRGNLRGGQGGGEISSFRTGMVTLSEAEEAFFRTL